MTLHPDIWMGGNKGSAGIEQILCTAECKSWRDGIAKARKVLKVCKGHRVGFPKIA